MGFRDEVRAELLGDGLRPRRPSLDIPEPRHGLMPRGVAAAAAAMVRALAPARPMVVFGVPLLAVAGVVVLHHELLILAQVRFTVFTVSPILGRDGGQAHLVDEEDDQPHGAQPMEDGDEQDSPPPVRAVVGELREGLDEMDADGDAREDQRQLQRQHERHEPQGPAGVPLAHHPAHRVRELVFVLVLVPVSLLLLLLLFLMVFGHVLLCLRTHALRRLRPL
mmetsp:Transcript_29743/g.57993  ORF Transcript_29743/g.57993 Transcript_29743/m.57993 type:complete len:222 (-) Transcript_29743:1228-1893(-)